MDIIIHQLREYPFIALFLAISLGYLIGKFRIGKFELGGIAGTLLVAVFLGQIGGIAVSNEVKNIFFALFIFAVGYNGGPQFFASFKLSSLTKLFASFSMTFLGLLTVLGVSIWAGLDKGLAAGLAAGGLTQSAIIGTAGNAINQLNVAPEVAQELKTNVAVGYSITYIFGSLGPILMMSIIPLIYGWDMKEEAKKLALKLGGGIKQLNEGEFIPLTRIAARAYKIDTTSKILNKKVSEIEELFINKISIENIINNDKEVEYDSNYIIKEDDILILNGIRKELSKIAKEIGEEVSDIPSSMNVVEERDSIILTNKKLNGLTIEEIEKTLDFENQKGVFISSIKRMNKTIQVYPKTELHLGDEITLIGHKDHIIKITKEMGYKTPVESFTDYIIMGIGMVIGFIIGEISFKLGASEIVLGSGLGCLVSGLFIGYLRSRKPKYGHINSGAAHFLQTFGLAVFVAVVGLNAGEPALLAIKEHGLTLLFLGFAVTLIPQIVQFIINYYILRINNPVETLSVIAGSRSANPAFAVLLDKTQNSTAVPSFTMTYAVANIFLTMYGPIIISLIPTI